MGGTRFLIRENAVDDSEYLWELAKQLRDGVYGGKVVMTKELAMQVADRLDLIAARIEPYAN